jgi:calcium-dependent protein kinase
MKIMEFYQDSERLWIVSEYFDGGELFDKITSLAHFTEQEAARVMGQMLSAVNYLHKNRIVHR